MVGGEQHVENESWTGGAWYVNRKESSWGQGDMVVERRIEGCNKSSKKKANCVASGRQEERARDI